MFIFMYTLFLMGLMALVHAGRDPVGPARIECMGYIEPDGTERVIAVPDGAEDEVDDHFAHRRWDELRKYDDCGMTGPGRVPCGDADRAQDLEDEEGDGPCDCCDSCQDCIPGWLTGGELDGPMDVWVGGRVLHFTPDVPKELVDKFREWYRMEYAWSGERVPEMFHHLDVTAEYLEEIEALHEACGENNEKCAADCRVRHHGDEEDDMDYVETEDSGEDSEEEEDEEEEENDDDDDDDEWMWLDL